MAGLGGERNMGPDHEGTSAPTTSLLGQEAARGPGPTA